MESVCGEDYTVAQLRLWLQRLNLPSSGTKSALIVRLNELPPERRGECPIETEELSSENECEDASGGMLLRTNECEREKQQTNESVSNRKQQASGSVLLNELLKKEMELVVREKELLKRERDLLKMIAEKEKGLENISENDREGSKTNESENDGTGTMVLPFNTIKEMIPEYDGDIFPDIWVTQFKNICSLYQVTENAMKALLMCKLRGKAQAWLHSNQNVVFEDTSRILDEMNRMFAVKENKLVLRKNFENRKWKYGEPFTNYYNEKIILSNKVGIDEEELIDYIIEGIPDPQLRVQASLQCFTNKSRLLNAFSKVELRRPKQQFQGKYENNAENKFRCYNCNSIGHFASECQKPKRELGACFGCGSKDHLVASCPERKGTVQMVAENKYVRYFKFSISSNFNHIFSLECLMDSGSAVSFVRRSSIFEFINFDELLFSFGEFFGINESKLDIVGKFVCYALIDDRVIDFEMLVVSDRTMSYDCVLGRNFLDRAGFKLTLPTDGGVLRTEEEFERAIMNIDVGVDDEFNLTVGDSLGLTCRQRLIDMYRDYYIRPERPTRPKVYSEIKLRLNDEKVFSCTPRRLSYAERAELQKLLDEYLEKGYIRPSESEFVSPIVLVRKKTGDLRLCVDYRVLNKMTLKDSYPIPLIDDLLDRLSGKRFFTKLDLKNGFFHVFVHPDSVRYTSFVTPLGQFEFLRMPFGLRNAPSVFQRFVNKVFADMVKDDRVIIYLDDIMIATTGMDEHFRILEEVFVRLVENNLELRSDKCEFFQTTVKYLGYTIDGNGIRADDKGVLAIRNFPVPDKQHSVQSFLGLCSYFRRFVKDFSVIAKPLYDLTKKDRKFVFGETELRAFELLKEKMVKAPVLALFDPRDETELHCDASSIGFGAVLLQRKSDGKFHPIFYFSKRTTDTESRYHSFELETLAIIYALKRFRIYLQGRKFKIVTDCNSLTMTLNRKELNPRIARWALELQNYDYELEHRSGSRMQHVDALSRSSNIMVIESNTFEENLVICQNRDEKIKELKDSLQETEHALYEMRNGVLYRKNDSNLLFYVPEEMEGQILYKYHNEMGHVGMDKMADLILKTYWFPKIRAKAACHIQNCLDCIVYSPKSGKEEGLLHNIPKSDKPFDVIHIDHYGPVDNGRALKHILVVIDACTKFVRLYPTRTTNAKEVISALSDYFRSYSRPRTIISDRGACFTSKDFADFLSTRNISHILIATGSPQANGQVERVNRSIGPMLAKLVDPGNGIFWDTVLERVEYSLNNTIHRSIGQHPSVMLFGTEQRGEVVDTLRECLDEVNKFRRGDIETIRQVALERQRKMQRYNEEYVNRRRKPAKEYRSGDYVMVRNFDSTAGVSRKLIPSFRGPYRISRVLRNDRYLLEDVDGFQQSRVPYRGVWSASNMRPWLRGRDGSKITD